MEEQKIIWRNIANLEDKNMPFYFKDRFVMGKKLLKNETSQLCRKWTSPMYPLRFMTNSNVKLKFKQPEEWLCMMKLPIF